MSKKEKFGNTLQKVEALSGKVDIIMQNRLIIALFLIVDGITFLLNPHGSLSEMARSIIILVLLAFFLILITNLSAKTKDIKSIVISIIILIVGIVLYIYPDLISAYIQLILALFIILNGLNNIANVLNVNKLSIYTKTITEKYNNIVNNKRDKDLKKEKEEKMEIVNSNFNEGIKQQKERLITPLKSIVDKSNKSSTLYLLI